MKKGGRRGRLSLPLFLLGPITKSRSHVIGFGEFDEEGNELIEFCVIDVVEPAVDRDGKLWLEHERGRRVVDDDGMLHHSSQSRHVLDVVSATVAARIAKQSMGNNFVDIKEIKNWICIFVETRCEDDDLVNFTHSAHKLVDSWSFGDVNLMHRLFNLDWDDKICVWDRSEGTVDKGFVQIKNETFSALVMRGQGREEILSSGRGRRKGLCCGGGRGASKATEDPAEYRAIGRRGGGG